MSWITDGTLWEPKNPQIKVLNEQIWTFFLIETEIFQKMNISSYFVFSWAEFKVENDDAAFLQFRLFNKKYKVY